MANFLFVLSRDDNEAATRCFQFAKIAHSNISIYLATQLLSQGRWALDHARNVDVPTFIMFGEDDELIDQSACENVAIRIGERATLVRWPGMRHDLFQETGRAEITQRLISWLAQITDAR